MNDTISPWLRSYLDERMCKLCKRNDDDSIARINEIERIFAQEEH